MHTWKLLTRCSWGLLWVLAPLVAPAATPPPPLADATMIRLELQRDALMAEQTALTGRIQALEKQDAERQSALHALDKELSVLKEVAATRLDAQDARIGDLDVKTGQQSNHLAAIANLTTWVGTAITLITLLAGFVGYVTVRQRASTEAQAAAQQWFDNHAQALADQIATLQAHVTQLRSEAQTLMETAASGVNQHALTTRERIDQAAERLLSGTNARADAALEDTSAIQQASRALEAKPEREFTADDHYTRGVHEWTEQRFDAALHHFDQALASASALPAEQQAKYLYARGAALGQLQRPEDALQVYEEVERRYGGVDPSPALRELVARALVSKGFTLGQLQRLDDTLVVYDEVERRYSADPSPALRELVARVWVNKGVMLEKLQRSQDALHACDEVERRYGADPSPMLREHVAKALVNKGIALGQLQQPEHKLSVYDEVERRYGADPSPALRAQVARAWVGKGFTLLQLNRQEDALQIYVAVERRYGDDLDPALREHVAKALSSKAVVLDQLQRPEDALQACDEVERRYGEDPSPTLREQVARALVSKGFTLGELQRPEDALQVHDEVERRFGADPSPAVREQVARAWVNKGFTLGRLQQLEDEVQVYDEVERRYGADPSPALRKTVARALLNKGITLGQLLRPEDALEACHEVERRYGEDPSPALREQVARAWVNKGITLGQLQRPEDEVQVYDEVERRYGADPSPALREPVARALNGRGFARLMEAKRLWPDASTRCGLLETAIRDFRGADAQRAEHPMVLGNLGYALFLSGAAQEATMHTSACLRLGGKAALEAQRGDAQQHRLALEDAAYEDLLERLWSAQAGEP